MTGVTCPFGHRFSTAQPGGSQVRCGRCRTETGNVVTVTVPGGPPQPARQRPVRAGTEWAGPCERCRTWSRRPAGAELPPGWLMLTIGTDPATEPDGRVSKTLGPYCGILCAASALKGTPRPATDSVRALMTRPPSGKDRR